ncbi:MAG: hypothetical protein PHV17_09240 [Candidatus Omnitrophica bacterium]|nr:hypothetical protein [Candidatus Omnitrophota bacterium]
MIKRLFSVFGAWHVSLIDYIFQGRYILYMDIKKNNAPKMPKWFFLLTCSLCIFLFAGCTQKDKTIKFKLFLSSSHDVTFYYPEDWHVNIFYPGGGAYIILVSEQEVVESSDTYRVGVGVMLMPADSKFPADNKQQALESIRKFILEEFDFLKLENKEISKEEEIVINKMPGLVQTISGDGAGYQKQHYRRSILTAVTMNRDTIINIAAEAPYDRFEEYKPIFNQIIMSLMAPDVVSD